jgi:hypothetical protein
VDKYVNGIRLLFRRVKPDGTRDEKDAYAGEWIGVAPPGKRPRSSTTAAGFWASASSGGAIVDRFALVAEPASSRCAHAVSVGAVLTRQVAVSVVLLKSAPCARTLLPWLPLAGLPSQA